MSIDETVIDKATIRFPRLISADEAEKMLCYFSTKGGMATNYSINVQKSVKKQGDGLTEKVETTRYVVSINASVIEPKSYSVNSFEYLRDVNDGSHCFSHLKFFTVPGWRRFTEYPPEVLQLWNNVRQLVGQYFKEKP